MNRKRARRILGKGVREKGDANGERVCYFDVSASMTSLMMLGRSPRGRHGLLRRFRATERVADHVNNGRCKHSPKMEMLPSV